MKLMLATVLALLLVACGSTSPTPESLTEGAFVKKTSPNVYIVYAPNGGSEIELERDEGARTRIYYKYRQNLPFIQIRNVEVTDVATGNMLDTQELTDSGQLQIAGDKLYIEPPEGGLHWRLKVDAPPELG